MDFKKLDMKFETNKEFMENLSSYSLDRQQMEGLNLHVDVSLAWMSAS